jgi:nucleolar protein 56
VATAVVVGNGPRLLLLRLPHGEASGFPWDSEPERAAARRSGGRAEDLPSGLVAAIDELPTDVKVVAAAPALSKDLAARSSRAVGVAELAELRAARAMLPRVEREVEREFVRAVAREALEQALRSPEELLVTLAREEERVERAVGREARAMEAFAQVPGSPLEGHRVTWEAAKGALDEHHRRLRSALEADARSLVPNLSAVVGPRVAARLLAAAGSLATLGRMSAPRLQLLGSRRRPSPERGPRYGVLYRADRMADLPSERRGAYARSLSALAAIAARADASTRRDLSKTLVARRDRRVQDLQRSRR